MLTYNGGGFRHSHRGGGGGEMGVLIQRESGIYVSRELACALCFLTIGSLPSGL